MSVEVRIRDHPGGLAELLEQVADLAANVISVEHDRTAADLGMGEVDVSLHLETRGPQHCAQVLAELRERGFRLRG
jgi:threonine dehydratase